MKVIIQRVLSASCTIDDKVYSSIDKGYVLLVGFNHDDTKDIVDKLVNKIIKLRLFSDENDQINLDIKTVSGSILSISQFTLYADCKKGNRPSFTKASPGYLASDLYDYFNEKLKMLHEDVKTGVFGADMKIALVNDGPVTIILDDKEL